jgi:hypothetical protein
MTIDRILGFAIGTILVGIGLKVGECIYKDAKVLFKDVFGKKPSPEKENNTNPLADATIVPSS